MSRSASSVARNHGPWLWLAGALLAAAPAAHAQEAQPPPTPAQVAPAPPTPAPAAPAATTTIYDPFEGANRGLFAVGMALDHVVVGPITHAYMGVTPPFVQRRVSAAVFNLGEPSTVLEDVLQGRPRRAGRATARFVINSTVGVLGLFDVADKWGLKPHASDFGQTLGRYGAQPGPYIYGVIAPFNLRDGIGRVVDVVTDPVGAVVGPITSTPGAIRTGATVVETRRDADPAFNALKDAQDPYVTVRSAYAQYREAIVNEGKATAGALPDFEPAP